MKTISPRGFTLIEMLVSVALFSIVMVVALGALISMSVDIRRAETINSAVNNVSSSMDSMSRSVRTGVDYHCGPNGTITDTHDCPSPIPEGTFTYLTYDNKRVTYCLSDPGLDTCSGTRTCASGSCMILRKIDSGPNVPLTAPEVQIKYLAFYVEGSSPLDTLQPRVTVVVSGSVPVTATQSSAFNIQTTVTQRVYDQ